MARIIVSYRRSDTAAIAGRIFDRLAAHYGEEQVFMDVDKIPFGTDFRKHIQEVLRAGDVLLAVIGPGWLGNSADGRSRIMDAADPVRVEVETALRQGITVIPVLVDDAAMPAAAELPESLADFAYLNAAPLDIGRDFRSHMDRLIRSMDGMPAIRGRSSPPAQGAAKRTTPGLSRLMLALASVAVVALTGALDLVGTFGGSSPPEQKSVAAPSTTAEQAKNTLGRLPEDIIWPGEAQIPEPQQKQSASSTYRVLANVSDGIQNMRSGPALKYPLVISIPAGSGGIVLGDCRPAEDNTRPWCVATWRKYSGWISSCCIVDEKTGAPPRIASGAKK